MTICFTTSFLFPVGVGDLILDREMQVSVAGRESWVPARKVESGTQYLRGFGSHSMAFGYM